MENEEWNYGAKNEEGAIIMCEKLDIYDENKIKTGKIIERKEEVVIEKNEFVLAVQCWIINTKKEILLTQRKLEKKYGGMWEATSGLVKSGENSIQGIKRELREEIGIEIEDKELKLLKTVKGEKTIRDIYIINKEIAIESIKFNDGEVINAKYVTIEEFKKMLEDGQVFEWLRWFLDDYYKIIKEE